MKKILLIILLFLATLSVVAEHIRGGEMYYRYLGPGTGNNSRYQITVKLYLNCNATGGQLDPDEPLTIFNKGSYTQVGPVRTAAFIREDRIEYDPLSNPCITNPPTDVCYKLRYYEVTIELPNSPDGYVVALQRCCRIRDIVNMSPPSNQFGATYTCDIPGTIAGVSPASYMNSSPVFNPNDAVAICYGSPFTFDFSATDTNDGDSIVYRLCNAYSGGGPGTGVGCATCAQPNPAVAPPYQSIPYQGGYSGGAPLGLNVTIDPKTGLLSGVAPNLEGQYVVTACAYEYRDQQLINIHRKDIHIRVSDCIPLKALLKPDYSYCDDFLVTFKNEQVNPLNSQYIWQYGDGTKADTTTDPEGRIQHLFADTGTYTIKLKVILAGQCVDSTTTLARVYPGFFPNFEIRGTCLLKPIQFNDLTTSRYGFANKWSWDFGDETTTTDVANIKTPSWQYSTVGMKDVRLIVESNKGCIDTLVLQADVRDKPKITLAFKDTLICSNAQVQDTLQLQASGNGLFSWSPLVEILRTNTPDPLVFPKTTTVYKVQLDENGCVNEDSVRVRVVAFVSLELGGPITICRTDTFQLKPVTDGLKFTWSTNPSPSPINDIRVREPLVCPPDEFTTYSVLAEIGKCSMMDNVQIKTVPYPTARAGADTTICWGDTASLHASMIAARFWWTPVNTLVNPYTLSPRAYPKDTTMYVLRVQDDLGCPKFSYDTVMVHVQPQLFAFAGNDTAVVIGEPLQMNGSGAEFYQWTPSTYLNRPDIKNPVAHLPNSFSYQLKVFTDIGCFDLDTIHVKLFRTKPEIFVPNAFRPDGYQNNVLRPVLVGITRMQYFRVYNRWGQLVFQTTQHGLGWNGTLGGKPQDSGMYVWEARGSDFTGKTVVKKGVALLIR